MPKTLVIAEPGCTHEGNYATTMRLIHVAAACGADVYKSQWVSSAARHLARRSARLSPDDQRAFRARYTEPYRWLQYPLDWHADFAELSRELGMQYACSVNLPEDVWTLEPFVDAFKIASFEFGDRRLVQTVAATEKVYWIGCGMTTTEDRQWLASNLMLFCTSAYPTPTDAADLATIRREGLRGYSDHTRHEIAGAVAVSQGATTVEAHYRLDECHPTNPDYDVAFAPAEFQRYIAHIRTAERLLGEPRTGIAPCEQPMAQYRVGV